jgi:hypothetical protein
MDAVLALANISFAWNHLPNGYDDALANSAFRTRRSPVGPA